MKKTFLFIIISILFCNSSIFAQKKELPVGDWITQYAGTELLAKITPELIRFKKVSLDDQEEITNSIMEYKILKVDTSTMPEPKGAITVKDNQGKSFEIMFLWNDTDEVLLLPFDIIIYKQEKYNKIQKLPQLKISERQIALDFTNKFYELFIEAMKKSIGSSGNALTQKVLTELGYSPFYDFYTIQDKLKKYINDDEIKEVGSKLATWNKLFEAFKKD